MEPLPRVYRYLALFVGAGAVGLLVIVLGSVYLFPLLQERRGHRTEIISLRQENKQLRQDVDLLETRYMSLKSRLDIYVPYDVRYSQMGDGENGIESLDIPAGLSGEGPDVQQAYRQLVLENQRWDTFLLDQYKHILETTMEPISVAYPRLTNADNLTYFEEMTASLKLHKKLIRDVRVFHSEIQFEQKHNQGDLPYKAYDYKLKLEPFARESSIADAMQQALSTLSTGVYHQEAVEVLDRLGDEFMRPVRQEYERLLSAEGEMSPPQYNYNIYLTFGKKIMDYADTLARQSSIPLASPALGELDFLHRRLYQSFHDLYELGQQVTIDAALLDMEELERTIQ